MRNALLLGLWLAGCVHPQALPPSPRFINFEFRGHQVGGAINEADLVAQGYECTRTPLYDRYCQKAKDRMGNVEVSTSYFLKHGQLAVLTIAFRHTSYNKIVEAFTAKFGAPHERRQETLHNQVGASFANETCLWHASVGTLEISSLR